MDPIKINISDDKKKIQIIKAIITDEIIMNPLDCKRIFTNDRFAKYIGNGSVNCELTIIDPVTKEDVEKYTPKKKTLCLESYNDY